jgi:hypothetical protein
MKEPAEPIGKGIFTLRYRPAGSRHFIWSKPSNRSAVRLSDCRGYGPHPEVVGNYIMPYNVTHC